MRSGSPSRFQLGERVFAQLVEINSDGSYIVNFQGDLLRVVNQSKSQFPTNSQVELVVSAVQPLRFQLASDSSKTSRAGINRIV